MKTPQVEINFGTPPGRSPRTSSDFEEISYPFQHTQPHPWTIPTTQHEETLPLHHMAEDTSARRRIARGPGSSGGFMSGDEQEESRYDDEGKDVYSKQRLATGRVASGRIHKPYSPPPTSIVRPPMGLSPQHLLWTDEPPPLDRIHPTKLGTCSTRNIHPPILLDTVS